MSPVTLTSTPKYRFVDYRYRQYFSKVSLTTLLQGQRIEAYMPSIIAWLPRSTYIVQVNSAFHPSVVDTSSAYLRLGVTAGTPVSLGINTV
jgi:hypothetical protein